jgi:hypothetical protein
MEMFLQDNRLIGAGREVVIAHGQERLCWEVSSLGLKTEPVTINGVNKIHLVHSKHEMVINTYDPFDQINSYWAQLPNEIVNNIFQTYKDINEAFMETSDRASLTFDLFKLIARLLDAHVISDVTHWINYRSNIIFSQEFKNEYIESPDKKTTREQTYLRQDYVQLVTMSVILRTMVPIWGTFIGMTRSDYGTLFKEYYAFELMKYSKLANSQAMEKLETYLKFTININKVDNFNSILNGISTENFPMWIMSLVVVRRLCIGDVRGAEKTNTLISTIYSFSVNKIKGGENGPNSANGIKEKPFQDKNDSEKASSRLEGYKIKQDIPPGIIVAIEDSVSDPYLVAKQVQPDIDLNLVTDALKTVEILMTNRIYDGQVTIAQWVLSDIVSPRGVGYLCKASVVRLLAVTQAILWHRGNKELAGIVTALALEVNGDVSFTSDSSRDRISKTTLEELSRLFPFERRPSLKKKTSKLINTALISINTVTDLLTNNTWKLTISDSFVPELNNGRKYRRYPLPRNIKILLANLVIELAGGKVVTV